MSDLQGEWMAPARETELQQLEARLGIMLPYPYMSFLKTSNGFSKEWVYLYGAQDVPRENEMFNIRKYSPEYLTIGDNGGGEAYVLFLAGSFPVYRVGHGSMHPDDMQPIAASFEDWASQGFPLPAEDNEPGWDRLVDVYLEKQPTGGTKDVYLIRKTLGLEIGVSQLLKAVSSVPISLLVGVPYGLYWEQVQELNQCCGECLSLRERPQ